MYHEKHPWKRFGLVFLQVTIAIRVNYICITIGGKMVLFPFADNGLIHLADEDSGKSLFSTLFYHQQTVFTTGVSADHGRKTVTTPAVCSQEFPAGAFFVSVHISLSQVHDLQPLLFIFSKHPRQLLYLSPAVLDRTFTHGS